MSLLPTWQFKLTESEENPYPLAPGDWVEKGWVTPENYRRENENWGRFVSRVMEAELPGLRGRHIEVLGAGLVRDLGWIPAAVKDYGCSVAIRDGEKVACRNALRFLRSHGLRPQVQVTMTEVLEGWRSGQIQDVGTGAYFMSQFLEHQGTELWDFMSHFGEFLRSWPSARVYAVVPLLEKNDPEEVKWQRASPPREEDLRIPLEEGLGRPAQVTVIGIHRYYHRHYTFFRITGGE